jgi:hypothetical protein
MPDDINIAHAGWEGAGTGAAKGAATGAAIGSIVPGVGTAIGAGVGAIVGGIAGFFGGRKREKALYEDLKSTESAEAGITGFDPRLTSFEKELRREKRMVETGMTPEFQVGKDLIERAGAGAMSVATRFNNPAMAISFMNQIQTGMGTNINKLVGTVGAQRGTYMAAIGDITQKLSQRELDVDVWKATQKRATFTQNLSDRNLNRNMERMQAVSSLTSIAGNFAGGFGGGGGGDASSLFQGTPMSSGMPGSTGPVSTSPLFQTSMSPLPPLKTF